MLSRPQALFAVTGVAVPAMAGGCASVAAAGLRAWFGADLGAAGAVCLRLARCGGCLPARAGLWIGDRDQEGDAAVADWVRRWSGPLHRRLAEIDGRVEFIATFVDRDADEPLATAPTGAAYLRALADAAARRTARRRALRDRCDAVLGALPTALTAAPRRLIESADGRLDLSLLAPRTQKAAFARAVVDATRGLPPTMRVVASGPWAPHSFADASVDRTAPASKSETADAACA